MDPNNQRPRRPSPEQAAVWILGIVLFAVVVFVVALTIF